MSVIIWDLLMVMGARRGSLYRTGSRRSGHGLSVQGVSAP